jgi:hypothetical protein
MHYNGEVLDYFNVKTFISDIFQGKEHSKRVESIASAALGIVASGSLIIHRIGRGMAELFNLTDKSAIKQVDRLLSNKKLQLSEIAPHWIAYLLGDRKEIMVTMDWTDFDHDNQSTLVLSLVTTHGRATPLLWKTVDKSSLKDNRNNYEDEVLSQLRDGIPEFVCVTILADRGFCDTKLLSFLAELKFDYIIRIRGNIVVEDETGEIRKAAEWVGQAGKTKTIRDAKLTNEKYEVPLIACKHAKQMKEPWCIVSSREELSGSWAIKWYEKRWGCEPQFRDMKDITFGAGLSFTHIKNSNRRDRLLLIHAIARLVLTLLGAAGEKIGLDKYLKSNTSAKRQLSLFKQGCIYFRRLFRMVKETAVKLIEAFYDLVMENKNASVIIGNV